MSDDLKNAIDEFAEESKYTIISMEDKEHSDQKKVLQNALEEINEKCQDLKRWMKNNLNTQEAKERFERLKEETSQLIARTRNNYQNFQNEDYIIEKKAKIKAMNDKAKNKIQTGVEQVKQNEHVNAIIQNFQDGITKVKEDEHVQTGVKNLKKGTLKIVKSAYEGALKILDDENKQK